MKKKEFKDLTRASISSLIKAGVIKSVSKELIYLNGRIMIQVESIDSTFAEIIIGKTSSKIIIENDGLNEHYLNEASLIITKVNDIECLRFSTTKYTDLLRIFGGSEDIKTKKKAAKDFKIITKMLEEYWE
jgi:hypothetical protein